MLYGTWAPALEMLLCSHPLMLVVLASRVWPASNCRCLSLCNITYCQDLKRLGVRFKCCACPFQQPALCFVSIFLCLPHLKPCAFLMSDIKSLPCTVSV